MERQKLLMGVPPGGFDGSNPELVRARSAPCCSLWCKHAVSAGHPHSQLHASHLQAPVSQPSAPACMPAPLPALRRRALCLPSCPCVFTLSPTCLPLLPTCSNLTPGL